MRPKSSNCAARRAAFAPRSALVRRQAGREAAANLSGRAKKDNGPPCGVLFLFQLRITFELQSSIPGRRSWPTGGAALGHSQLLISSTSLTLCYCFLLGPSRHSSILRVAWQERLKGPHRAPFFSHNDFIVGGMPAKRSGRPAGCCGILGDYWQAD